MKRLIAILLSAMLIFSLSACNKNAETSSQTEESKSSIVTSLPDTKKPKTLIDSGENSSIKITIPLGWEYDTSHYNDINYSFSFWPENRGPGKILVRHCEVMAVPDITAKEENITLGKYTAKKVTFDGYEYWDHIIFVGVTGGCYVVINDGAQTWWDEYENEAMDILATLELSEGYVNRQKVIDIAKASAPKEYRFSKTDFDENKEVWHVLFTQKNDASKTKTIRITTKGKILN